MKISDIQRPLDHLNICKGKKVIIGIVDWETNIEGILLGFDIHINLVIKQNNRTKFIRGVQVIFVDIEDEKQD